MIQGRWLPALGAAGLLALVAAEAGAQNSFGQPGQPYTQPSYGQPQQPYPPQGGQPYPGQQGRPYPGQEQGQGQGQGQAMPATGYGTAAPQGGMQGGMGMPQGMPGQGMQQPMPGRGAMPQGYPQQGGPGYGTAPGGPGNGPGYGKGPSGPQSGGLDHLARMERQDFGVRPTARLHQGRMHGPTPASIPGGQVVTTKGFVELLRRRQAPVLILDVLGGPERIPGAQNAVPAHQAGSFKDQTQRQFGEYLARATRGNKQHPLVLYCASPQCWMSYNAALRAIKMGYTNVLWYRGGIEFWKRAGQRVERAR